MTSEQFDEFWEVRCPKCNERIDFEILINQFNKKLEEIQRSEKKKC